MLEDNVYFMLKVLDLLLLQGALYWGDVLARVVVAAVVG